MDDDRLACIGLASKGYGAGDPDTVGEMDVSTVIDLLVFTRYQHDYLSTWRTLNEKEPRG